MRNMKKLFLLFAVTLSVGSCAYAEAMPPLPIMNNINHSIYSTEATKPLYNIEKNHYTNDEIIRLEKKDKKQENPEKEPTEPVVQVKEKVKFRDLFKGFTVDW